MRPTSNESETDNVGPIGLLTTLTRANNEGQHFPPFLMLTRLRAIDLVELLILSVSWTFCGFSSHEPSVSPFIKSVKS